MDDVERAVFSERIALLTAEYRKADEEHRHYEAELLLARIAEVETLALELTARRRTDSQ